MSKRAPLFATSKTAASLFELKTREFLKLVEQGVLPKPQKIGPYERWATDAQIAAITGHSGETSY